MSEDLRKDLPPVNSPNFLEKLREAVATYLGNRGDKLDRGITLRDLVDSNIVSLRPGFLNGRNGTRNPIGGTGDAFTLFGNEPDLTPPPTPTEFTAAAAITSIIITTGAANYKQGHGHAKTKIYGYDYTAGGALPTFSQAKVITEFSGSVFSYATFPATTWRLWATWVSRDGVESTLPAGGPNGLSVTTGQDVAKLVAILAGSITSSELATSLNTRINVIDGGALGTALPYSLTRLAADQTGLNQTVAAQLTTVGSDLLNTLVTLSNTETRIADAGVYVEPGTGLVKISGLEATKTQLNTVDVRLAAAEGAITLKASTTYVDNAISSAVIDPSQIPVFTTLQTRIQTAEVDISSLTASVALKAATLSLDATNVRMTTAETNISALTGTVSTKVSDATFTSVTGGLDTRLGTAETTLSSFGDTSQISNIVKRSYGEARAKNAAAEDLLRAILNTDNEATYRDSAIALARSDLTAYADAGISAEAAARISLGVLVDGNTASIVAEQIARANADSAEATARQILGVRVDTAEASIVAEQIARANADGVLTSTVAAQSASIGDNTAQITDIKTARIGYCSIGGIASDQSTKSTCEAAGGIWTVGLPLASAVKQVSVTDGSTTATLESRFTAQKTLDDQFKLQYSVKLDNNGYVTGYGLFNVGTSSEFIVNANKFAVTIPDGSVTTRTNYTSYVLGQCVAASTGTMAVCKGAGTSGGSTPNFAQDIGTVVTDGTVIWQIASRVQLAVLSSSTTINGKTLTPGVYMDGGFIANATINNAQIGSIRADKIKTGTLTVGLGGAAGFLTSQAVETGAGVAKPSTDYASTWNTTGGYYLGDQGGTHKFYVGNGSNSYLQWNGSALEATGLVIRNSSGAVILASDTTSSQILNSSVTYASLADAKPPVNADNTASNTAAGIAGQGALATANDVRFGSTVKFSDGTVATTANVLTSLAKITTGTIDNFFTSAAIGDAYIGNLNASKITAGFIDVARIRVGTATASTTGYVDNENFYPTAGAANHTAVCAASATLTTSGGGVPLLVMARIDSFIYFGSNTGTHCYIQGGLYMDGSEVSSNINSSAIYIPTSSGSNAVQGTIFVMYRTTTIAAGSHTFRVRVYAEPRDATTGVNFGTGAGFSVSASVAILENKV